MSQNYYTDFDPAEIVQTTMDNLIDGSIEALRSKFSGTSEPTEKIPFQSWIDKTANLWKILDASLVWRTIYDFNNNEIYIKDGQITSTKISTAARRGSIVTDEDIDPHECTIRTPFTGAALPVLPEQQTFFGIDSPSNWWPMYTTKVHVPNAQNNLYMQVRLEKCKARFVVGSVISGETSTITGPAWSSEISANVSALSGWQTLVIQGWSTEPSPSGGLRGVSSRWGGEIVV